jgi:hypothetical protein
VITPTVVDPVIMLPIIPRVNGRRMVGSPLSTKKPATTATAGVPLRIALRETPRPVTTRIIADTRRASSTHTPLASDFCSRFRIFS